MYNKEYSIFVSNNGGELYNLQNYKNFYEVSNALQIIIEGNRKTNKPYFVTNDFYENEFPECLSKIVYSVKEREVSDWVLSSNNKEFKNNIYFFPNIY